MAELGNILATPQSDDGPRGPDLQVEVEVPRRALGTEAGFEAPVPREIEHGGELIERAASPLEDGEVVTLRLPEGFPDGGTIKLRGQGGVHAEGRPGDLLVTVRLVDTSWLASRRGRDDALDRDADGVGGLSPLTVGVGVGVGALVLAGLGWLLGWVVV